MGRRLDALRDACDSDPFSIAMPVVVVFALVLGALLAWRAFT